MESRGMVLKNLFIGQQGGETDIENRLLDVGRGEERVRCMERVTWMVGCRLWGRAELDMTEVT